MANDWLELRQHADTGIETIRAHFEGHAYDPHWHDSYPRVGDHVGGHSAVLIAAASVIAAGRATHFYWNRARSTMAMRPLPAVLPT